MKVAICISGAFRKIKRAFPSYQQHLLGPLEEHGHDIDVYFSSWDSKIKHFKVQINDDSSLEEVVELYKPKMHLYEPYDAEMRANLYKWSGMQGFQLWAKKNPTARRMEGRWVLHQLCHICNQFGNYGGKCRICGGENVHNQIGMLWNVKESITLATEVQDYDIVIRTRFDNIYQEDFPAKLLHEAGEEGLYIPSGDNDFLEYGGGCNDQFAFGRHETMCFYALQYNNMAEFAKINYATPGGYGIPHKSINNTVDKYALKLIRFPFKYAIQKRLDGK